MHGLTFPICIYSRDDKRYTEKKNKSERARRKKEDTARLRRIVDLTLQFDPRIKRIKQEEKEARDAKKRTKTNGSGANTPSKAAQEEAKRKAEEEAKAKEEAEKASTSRFDEDFSSYLFFLSLRPKKLRQRRLRLLLRMLPRRLVELPELQKLRLHELV